MLVEATQAISLALDEVRIINEEVLLRIRYRKLAGLGAGPDSMVPVHGELCRLGHEAEVILSGCRPARALGGICSLLLAP